MHPCTSGGVENSNSNHKQLKCMATVKVKLRESTVGGKAGVIYYQLCHRRKSQQVITSMRLQPRQWVQGAGVSSPPLSAKPMRCCPCSSGSTVICVCCIRSSGISNSGRKGTRSGMLSIGFASPGGAPCSPMSKRRPQGSRRTGSWGRRATTGGHSGVSPISWGGRDIPFSLVDERLVGQYDDWLRRRGVVRNTVSFYMRILRAVYNRAVKEDVVPQADPFRHVYTGVDQTCKRAVGEMSSCGSGSWI